MNDQRDDANMDELMERVWDALEDVAAAFDDRDSEPTNREPN